MVIGLLTSSTLAFLSFSLWSDFRGGFKALVGLQNIVTALSGGVFHFVIVRVDFESPSVVILKNM